MRNLFIVSSNINCVNGVFTPEKRYVQTQNTLQSIRTRAPGSKIIIIDNSNEEFTGELDVDYRVPFEHNLFTRFVNKQESKGVAEAYQMVKVFDYIRDNNIECDRIFKISGRYNLAEGFDIKEYENEKYKDKYAFRINEWDVSTPSGEWQGLLTVRYYETRLYSFCRSMMDEYEDTMKDMFEIMITNWGKLMMNWEMCHSHKITEDKVVAMKPIYVEGHNAVNGEYRFE